MKVYLDTQVEIEFSYKDGERETLQFNIVPEEQADYYAGFLGVCTPLAQALMGHHAGDKIDYQVGDVRQVTIHSVTPSTHQDSTNRAAQREEVIRQAVAESELKDRIAIATSVDNKWGDYDPAGLLDSLEDSSDEPGKV